MKRLQLGSSLGSSMDATLHRTENQAQMRAKSQSIDVSSINHKDCKLMSDWYSSKFIITVIMRKVLFWCRCAP